MAGNLPRQLSNADFSDPFNAGQMAGMLVILTFIEKNKGIPVEILNSLKLVAANNLEEYFEQPTEDIFLTIDGLVKEMQ